MPKFYPGTLVKFTDKKYAQQERMEHYYNKECIILNYPPQSGFYNMLVRVKFWDGFVFTAFEKRFTLGGNLKSALEVKINIMWNRQPYIAGNKHRE